MARLTPSVRTAGTIGSGAQTATVSIPAGTVKAVVGFFFFNAANSQAPTSVTLDGQTCTKRASIEVNTANMVALYDVTGVSTGAGKTLAYTNPSAQTFINIGIEFRDTGLTLGNTGSNSQNAANVTASDNIAVTTGDEIISGYGCDVGTAITVGTGQTKLDETTTAGETYAFTTESPSTGTDTQSVTGDFPGIASIGYTPFAVTAPVGIKSPVSSARLNPGGVLVAPNAAAPGKSPSYGATRWQQWESYPWGPFVAPAAQVPQPWFIQYQPTTPRTEAEQLPVLQTSQQILFGRTTPTTQSRAPWYLWQPPVRTPAGDELPPKTTDYFVLLYGRPQIVLVTQAYFFGSPFVVPDADGLPPIPPPNLNAFRFPATVATQAGQPWYLWPQPQRQEEAVARTPQRDGDLHLYRFSFQTVGQPLAMFARVSLPRVELETATPPTASTQLFFGRVLVTASPGQPWFMWKGYQPQLDTEIFRQPEIPSLLLIYGRPQVIPPPAPTAPHQVNLSASFGIGLNWMGTRI